MSIDMFGKENFKYVKKNIADFNNKSLTKQKSIIDKTAVYNLPLIKKFHAFKKLNLSDVPNEVRYKNFGLNWWDIFSNGFNIQNEYEIPTNIPDPCTGILLINLGIHEVVVENKHNKDTYHIQPNEISIYNVVNHNKIIVYDKHKKNISIQPVIYGQSLYIYINPDYIIDKQNKIINSPVYYDFFISCGILNRSLYYYTTGLNANVVKVEIIDDKVDTIENPGSMQDFVGFLEDHWTYKCNLKLKKIKDCIPRKIHWVWLAKDLKNKEYFDTKKFAKFMETWAIRNPNCELNLWTDFKKIDIPDLNIRIRNENDIDSIINKINPKSLIKNIKKLIKTHHNVGIRSDTLRQVILYVEGGIYCDINDMCCLISLEDCIENFNFICGVEPMLYINNAIIGAKPKHEINLRFLKFLSYNIDNTFNNFPDQDNREEIDCFVCDNSGPIKFSSIIYGAFVHNNEIEIINDLEDTIIFPCKFLYSNYDVKKSSEFWLTPMSLTAHYDDRSFI